MNPATHEQLSCRKAKLSTNSIPQALTISQPPQMRWRQSTHMKRDNRVAASARGYCLGKTSVGKEAD